MVANELSRPGLAQGINILNFCKIRNRMVYSPLMLGYWIVHLAFSSKNNLPEWPVWILCTIKYVCSGKSRSAGQIGYCPGPVSNSGKNIYKRKRIVSVILIHTWQSSPMLWILHSVESLLVLFMRGDLSFCGDIHGHWKWFCTNETLKFVKDWSRKQFK